MYDVWMCVDSTNACSRRLIEETKVHAAGRGLVVVVTASIGSSVSTSVSAGTGVTTSGGTASRGSGGGKAGKQLTNVQVGNVRSKEVGPEGLDFNTCRIRQFCHRPGTDRNEGGVCGRGGRREGGRREVGRGEERERG